MQSDELTAKAWILMDIKTKKYLRGHNTLQKYEIASITKMFTLQACLDLNDTLNIKPQLCKVQITQSTTIGTLAHLEPGKYLTVQDLYYGLMLPSGNDAAILLAYYYGFWIGKNDKFHNFQWKKQQKFSLQGKKKFMTYLNNILVKQKLHLGTTHFENPHGLPDKFQFSNAWEVGLSTLKFLQNSKFALISRTQKYATCYDDGEEIEWQNTNILLKDGYIGIKTGHTVTAGNCLCSRKMHKIGKTEYDLVLVILGCKTLEKRFSQTKILIDDFQKYLKQMNL